MMVEVNLYIFIASEGSALLTPERVKLLRLVRSCGSLLLASKRLGISYNKAWKMIYDMNALTKNTVVEKKRGGSGGGGTLLTSYGLLLMDEYDSIEKKVMDFNQRLNNEIRM